MTGISINDLESRYGIPRQLIKTLARQGLVEPVRGPRREYRFQFADVVLMRMAAQLKAAGVTLRRQAEFLKQIQDGDNAAHAMRRLTSFGKELVLREGERLVNSQGQYVFDFPQPGLRQNVAALRKPAAATAAAVPYTPGAEFAEELFVAAEMTESHDRDAACQLYRQAIESDPSFLPAYLNLCCCLIEEERLEEAAQCCKQGIRCCKDAALLHFNLALVHEDRGDSAQAIASYQNALEIDPALRDAHYNLANLFEAAGDMQQALRHMKDARPE